MGRQLLADEPAFAAAVAELEPDFVAQVGFSLRDVLLAGEPVVGIERIQPVLVGMQLALTALWRSYGVEPDAVIGHSMGEVTAAVVSGALSPADGLKVIATRSKLMSRLSGQGAMALLELGAAEAEKLVGQYPDVTVAVYAAPQQTVIAGPPEQVDAAIAAVDAQGLVGPSRRGGCGLASPDGRPDPGRPQGRVGRSEAVDAANPVDQHGRSGRRCSRSIDADYWVVNLRNPVRFSQAVAKAAETHHTFVEISPHPLLTHGIGETLASVSSRDQFAVTAAMKRGDDETLSVHEQLATLGVTGDRDRGPSPGRHSGLAVAARQLLGREEARRPALDRCPPAAGCARRTAVGPRARLADRHRCRGAAVAGRSDHRRPGRRHGSRFRRDGVGCRHPGARRRCTGQRAGRRAAADPGRPDPRHHTAFAEPGRESG